MLLVELISLIEVMFGASLILLGVVVNDAIFVIDDVLLCRESVDIVFTEGFVSVRSDEVATNKKITVRC